MKEVSRRTFLELTLAAGLGALVAGCGSQPQPTAEPTAGPGAPTRVRGKAVLNENRPDRNVRYFKPFVPPTPEEWKLTVNGLVSAPLELSIAGVQQLPAMEQESRLKCVECWSFRARWGGFALAPLLEQVRPSADARFVRMTCGDGYWEVLPVEDLLRERVLFAYRMEGEFLADEYGSPLRLIVPWKYGYKGAKCITGLEFTAEQKKGYWSTVGPYSVPGDIQTGYDHPQETGGQVRIEEPGVELPY